MYINKICYNIHMYTNTKLVLLFFLYIDNNSINPQYYKKYKMFVSIFAVTILGTGTFIYINKLNKNENNNDIDNKSNTSDKNTSNNIKNENNSIKKTKMEVTSKNHQIVEDLLENSNKDLEKNNILDKNISNVNINIKNENNTIKKTKVEIDSEEIKI